MELSYKQLLPGNYVIIVDCFNDSFSMHVGRVITNEFSTFRYHWQSPTCLESSYPHYREIIVGYPFHELVLEMEKWKYDSDSKMWIDPSGRVTIMKNPEMSPRKYRVHIDDPDMDSIGTMDFEYFHELQSYCQICGIDLNFRFGTMRYVCNEFIEPQLAIRLKATYRDND